MHQMTRCKTPYLIHAYVSMMSPRVPVPEPQIVQITLVPNYLCPEGFSDVVFDCPCPGEDDEKKLGLAEIQENSTALIAEELSRKLNKK